MKLARSRYMARGTVVLGNDGLWSWLFGFVDPATADDSELAKCASMETFVCRRSAQLALIEHAHALGYRLVTVWNGGGRATDAWFRRDARAL